jgi:hypothetical protein
MTTPDLVQAIEEARCAYVNIKNLMHILPLPGLKPLFTLTQTQVRNVIVALDGERGTTFCDLMDANT